MFYNGKPCSLVFLIFHLTVCHSIVNAESCVNVVCVYMCVLVSTVTQKFVDVLEVFGRTGIVTGEIDGILWMIWGARNFSSVPIDTTFTRWRICGGLNSLSDFLF